MSRSTYKWYPTSGTHEDRKHSRNGFIDKTNKWLHDRKLFKVVSHFYTLYKSYKTVVPQVILNFKWSSNEEKFPHTTRAQAYQIGWLMLWHRGRCPTYWYQGQRSYMSDSGVIPTYMVVSIKNARFKCQPSTPMQPFVSRDAHLLWKLIIKTERLRQRYYNWGFGHGRWTKREQHWRMEKDPNSWTREAHK